ncbi:cupredoxin domain-containing protein [Candidatus Azambacteria bacterium]|nr:cupredoxin domain-containing protein [Candidatus Azambacteria bacterium]
MNKKYLIVFAVLIGLTLFLIPYIFRKEEAKKEVKKSVEAIINNSSESVPGSKSSTTNVNIENFSFVPEEINIKKGETVVWTEKDDAPHTVTASNKEDFSGSGTLLKGDTYSFTFNKVGSFTYRCKFHSNMIVVVNVKE